MAERPRLLDLYSCAGGAAMGYHRAGFEVVGVDLAPQPRYPFEFHRGDALELGAELLATGTFQAVHASPPCQRFSTLTAMHGAEQVDAHPDLVEPTRALLRASGLPYVIENVEGAPLIDAVRLCGTMYGLGVPGKYDLIRHRRFEVGNGVELWPPATCAHRLPAIGIYGHPGGSSSRDLRKFGSAAEWRVAMGVEWMTNDELAEAIPPAYTEHVGAALLRALQVAP